jgi:hypothetical protein
MRVVPLWIVAIGLGVMAVLVVASPRHDPALDAADVCSAVFATGAFVLIAIAVSQKENK